LKEVKAGTFPGSAPSDRIEQEADKEEPEQRQHTEGRCMTEPFEEKPQGTAETSQPHEPEQPREKRSRPGLIAGAAGMTALAVLFALLFAAFNNRSTATGGAPLPTAPAGWQRYSDPGGHFTVLIPKGWTVHSESGTGTEGSSRGSVNFHDTMNAFGGPPNGQKTITVWIYVQPIESDLARQVKCDFGFYKHNNTTLAGLSAWYNDNATWIVESRGAHFQISYAYPNYKGDVMIPANAPSPTPMPPGFYEKGQQDLHTILASFMPTPDTPLKCP
jgi:hypothetical protein